MLQQKLQQKGNNLTCPVAVIVREGKVLLGLRNYTPDKWKKTSVWTLPGGRCNENETLEETLRRETKEEVGINDLDIIEFIGEFLGAKEGDVVPVFLCESNQKEKLIEPHKFSTWSWFGKDDFPDDFINKDIRPVLLKLVCK